MEMDDMGGDSGERQLERHPADGCLVLWFAVTGPC